MATVRGDLTAVLAVAGCAIFVTVAEPVTITLLRRAAALDVPTVRSSHTVPTPRGGGLPIVIGLAASVLLAHGALGTALIFAGAVLAFAAIGFADDLAGLPAAPRLALQATASLAVMAVLASRSGLAAEAVIPAVVAGTIWLTGFVNAFNFLDGINGISAVHALAGGAVFGLLGWRAGDTMVTVGGGALAAGALAFLPWNASARVFLGDVGSYGIGVALALLAAMCVLRGVPPEVAAGPLALYLADTAWTLQRRIRAGERWLKPHRTHVYQRLYDAGWPHSRICVVTGALTMVLSALGAVSLSQQHVLRAGADVAAVGLLVCYLRLPTLLTRAVVAEAA